MKLPRTLLLAFVLSASANVFADEVVDQGRTLIQSGQAAKAWELLSPLNDERAGDAEFDYLLGIAALDTGHYTEAVFALERVVLQQPDNALARADLAKAYFHLNENKRARETFEQAKAGVTEVKAIANIDKFISAIDKADAASNKRTTLTYFAEATFGHDTNVNSGPSDATVGVPLFGGALVTLNPGTTQTSDNYLTAKIGVRVAHKIGDSLSIIGGGTYWNRHNQDLSNLDTDSLSGDIGLQKTIADNTFSASFQVERFRLDGSSYREMKGLTGQWTRNLSTTRKVSAYLQIQDLNYPGQSIRDARRHVIGGNYSSLLPGKKNPIYYVGLYAGQEDADDSTADHLGHDFWGIKVGGQVKLTNNAVAFGSISNEERNYGGTDPFFLVGREDTVTTARMGVKYSPRKNWSLIPELVQTNSSSNVPIYDTDRTQLSLTVRRDFD